MSESITVQKSAGNMEQYDQHVASQSRPVQVIHRGLTLLHGAGLGLVVAVFVKALAVSIGWTRMNVLEIPFWWFAFAASMFPFCLCFGLDVILVRAIPPMGRGKQAAFTRGYRAILYGTMMIVVSLAWAALHATFAYTVFTLDMDALELATRFLSAVIGIGAAVHLLSRLQQRLARPVSG